MLLDQMRKHSRSFIIYIFFGIIIAVFVINFGPQSAGCVASTSHAGHIGDRPIALNDFNYALAVSGLRGRATDDAQLAQVNASVMDQLIARELLADAARQRGMRIPDREIDEMLLKGDYLALGMERPMVRTEEGKFDYNLFSKFVRYQWGISARKFKEQQRRELLAEQLKRTLRDSVRVSEDDVEADYLHRNNKVKLSYVRFAPASYRGKVTIDDTALAAFVKANAKKIERHYQTNKKTAYSGLKPQVQLRAIRVRFDGAPGRRAAAAKIKRLAAKIKAGGDFAALARASSDHESARAGGLLSWRNADKPAVGENADKAVAKLKKGKVSAVIAEKDAFWLLRLEGRREGDLTLAQATDEIAREMFVDEEARRLALADAQALIKRARAGAKLEDLFTTEDDPQPEGKGKGPASKPAAAKAKAGKRGKPGKSPLKLRTTAFFPRSPQHLVPGIGMSKDLTRAAFELDKGKVAAKPFTVGSMVYLVAIKDRQSPDVGRWAQGRSALIARFRQRVASERVHEFTVKLCERAVKDGHVAVDPRALMPPLQPGQKRKKPIPNYVPCKMLAAIPFPIAR